MPERKKKTIGALAVVFLLLMLAAAYRYVPVGYCPLELKLADPLPAKVNVGDEITVHVRLTNISDRSYAVYSSSPLIKICFYRKGGQKPVDTANCVKTVLFAGQSVDRTETYKPSEPGTYLVEICCRTGREQETAVSLRTRDIIAE